MKQSIDIILDKPRKLRYGWEALAYIEESLNKPAAQIDFNNLFVKDVAAIIAAGLVHESPGITAKDILKILDEHDVDIEELTEKVRQAMEMANATGKK